jgi:hypothetical protein
MVTRAVASASSSRRGSGGTSWPDSASSRSSRSVDRRVRHRLNGLVTARVGDGWMMWAQQPSATTKRTDVHKTNIIDSLWSLSVYRLVGSRQLEPPIG